MAIPAGIIFPWPSTVGTIPAGWSRVVALDSQFLRGATVAGAAGGNATHTHTVTDHTHVNNAHTHTISLGGLIGACLTHPWGPGSSPRADVPNCVAHIHNVYSISTAAPLNLNAAVTLNVAASDPPNWVVIWIESDGTGLLAPNILSLWSKEVLPASWSWPASGKGAFLKGAAPAGNGGAVAAAAHSHTGTGHTHVQNPHRHSGTVSPQTVITGNIWDPTPNTTVPQPTHSHTSFFTKYTTVINQNATVTTVVATTDPPHVELTILQNSTAGNLALRPGMIAVWTGPAATIPTGWVLCDGENGTLDLTGDILIKGTAVLANVGNAGGNTVHGHIAIAHTHVQNGHDHDGPPSNLGTGNPTMLMTFPGDSGPSRLPPHSHLVNTSTTVGTNQNTTVTVADWDGWPAYTEVLWIMHYGGGGVDMLRVRPPDVWIARTPAADSRPDHPIDLTDMDGGWNRDAYQPHAYLDADATAKASIIRVGGQKFCAIIPQAPGEIVVAPFDGYNISQEGEVVIAGDWRQVSMEIMPAGSMLAVLCLKEDSGNLRWFQSMGDWNQAAGSYTMIDPPVECDTDPGGDFQNALDSCASLRRTPGGGLLFTFIDEDYDIRTFRCVKVEEDATGVWEEV